MTTDSKTKQPLPLWRRIALTLIVLAMAAMAGIMAADYIIAKGLGDKIIDIQKSGQPVMFSQLASAKTLNSADDAAMIYTKVLNSTDAADIKTIMQENAIYKRAILSGNLGQVPAEVHQKVSYDLKQFHSSMLELDRAANMEISNFDIGITKNGKTCIENIEKAHKVMQLLSLRTLYFIAMKEYDRAGESILSLLSTSRIFESYPTVSASIARLQLLGLACDNTIILLRSGEVSDGVTGKIFNKFIEADNQQMIIKALQAERVFQIQGIKNILPGSVQQLISEDSSEFSDLINLPSSRRARIKVRLTVSKYFDEMNNLIRVSSKPWPELISYINEQKNDSARIESSMTSKPYGLCSLAAATTTIVRCTEVALYIEKYRRANQKLPGSLSDLAVDIPTDLYSGNSLFYTVDDIGYIIYGTGPDKINNGGDIQPKISATTGEVEKAAEDVGIKVVTYQPQPLSN